MFYVNLLIAVCSAIWVFYKFQDHSGQNTKQSVIASAVVGAVILVLLLLVTGLFK